MLELINNSFLFDEIVNGADLLTWIAILILIPWAISRDRKEASRG